MTLSELITDLVQILAHAGDLNVWLGGDLGSAPVELTEVMDVPSIGRVAVIS